MGAVKNGSKFNGVAIDGVIVNGFAKGGQVVYKKEQFDTSTKAVFDFATTQGYTLPTNKNAFDTLIRDMKNIGIWNLLDNFYLFTGDGGNNFKRINLINPNKYQATYFGGLEITTNGVKGNGVNAYIDTSFNPSLLESGQKYQLNDASRGAVISSEAMGSNAIRFIDLTQNGTNTLANASNTLHRINQGVNSLPINVDMLGTGFKSISRYDSSNVSLINKSYNNATTRNSTIIENEVQLLIGRANASFSVIGISSYFMGSSISFEISQNFRTIFNKYLSSIGLTPIA